MNKYNLPLESDKYYHIYNHAVGKSNLFETEANYYFFLEKFKQYISPIADTFAYCLLPNHFHFAVRIKSESILSTLPKFWNFGKVKVNISKQFSNLFSSYTQAFNKQQNCRGTLFEKPFKRKHINSEEYFRTLIHYIHYNPVHHGFTKDIQNWKYTSYESYFSTKSSLLKREEAIEWFDNLKSFEEFHKKEINDKILIELE